MAEETYVRKSDKQKVKLVVFLIFSKCVNNKLESAGIFQLNIARKNNKNENEKFPTHFRYKLLFDSYLI